MQVLREVAVLHTVQALCCRLLAAPVGEGGLVLTKLPGFQARAVAVVVVRC